MKNIVKPIIALFALFVVSCSVEDIQDRPVIEAGDVPVLTAPTSGATYVLLPENAEKQVERFTWKSSNYGGAVEVTYAVQVDLKGAKFAKAKTIGSAVSQNQVSVTQAVLNTAALTLGATPFTPVEMEVRVQSTLGTTSPLFSNVIAIVVTPYTTEAPKIAVPGNHQGWSPGNAPLLAASGYGKTDFEGYVSLDGEYKFVGPNAGGTYSWGNDDWGDDKSNTGKLALTGEDNCTATAGYYRVKADTKGLTYSATLISTWGIIGSGTAGDWSTSTPMTYNATTKVWTVTTNLTAAEFKFRANNAWDIDLGDYDSGKPGVGDKMSYGGKNIVIPSAGNYTITLDLSSPRNYKYTLTKN
jgi:hypothetical protein